eukprot:8627192-Prorocentrum_lima.AAC.1
MGSGCASMIARSPCVLDGFDRVCGCVWSRRRWCRPVKSRSSVMFGCSWLMNPVTDACMSIAGAPLSRSVAGLVLLW